MALDNTINGEQSNSYVDLAYANAYWDTHFNATKSAQWDALSDDQKSSLLIQACSVIESARFTEPATYSDWQLVYDSRRQQVRSVKTVFDRPEKWNYLQNLQFPRTLDVLSDGTVYVPPEVLNAQCEQAVYILNFDDSVLSNRMQGVTRDSINVNGISLSQSFDQSGTMFSPVAREMLRKFFIKGSTRVQRG